jgi:hypothetical protein
MAARTTHRRGLQQPTPLQPRPAAGVSAFAAAGAPNRPALVEFLIFEWSDRGITRLMLPEIVLSAPLAHYLTRLLPSASERENPTSGKYSDY